MSFPELEMYNPIQELFFIKFLQHQLQNKNQSCILLLSDWFTQLQPRVAKSWEMQSPPAHCKLLTDKLMLGKRLKACIFPQIYPSPIIT